MAEAWRNGSGSTTKQRESSLKQAEPQRITAKPKRRDDIRVARREMVAGQVEERRQGQRAEGIMKWKLRWWGGRGGEFVMERKELGLEVCQVTKTR
ncbi:hypothetical protein AHAS_Ahas16G0143900 [Arachis hypogaea]